ncbi:HesA/MoeB/ThiF family protein [Zavarzinia compransoris]|uniref:Molybdopterin-synthase adenylyltransferase n=1 Tax=Zavarzinia compransoris TaxID=1264899 RepID=A0A317E3K0_9PROT|nr:molybdopterin-synthase adenylyltransferase MoeB [Zavarzinia compransoris]PWR20780.1 molybdopterin biosynthesis protein MoeB [Zavarzinia compransoris]TDP44385.1 adenylyltransferase/sulfurtransferase [Zavarzinia compransoris]
MLTDEQLDRYARHIILREVGGAGQARLLAARVLIVGAGGLGAPAALYLAAAGVGTIGLVDDDTVSLSNLQRQIIYAGADLGRPKVAAAADTLARLDPGIRVVGHPLRLDDAAARDLVQGYDLILDGTDNFATRHIVNRACVAAGRVLVSGAVAQFEGQVATFTGHLKGAAHPCYHCFVPEGTAAAAGCAAQGVLGAVTGVVGSLMAVEALKELTGAGDSLAGRLVLYDALSTRFRTLRLAKDPACPVCSGG